MCECDVKIENQSEILQEINALRLPYTGSTAVKRGNSGSVYLVPSRDFFFRLFYAFERPPFLTSPSSADHALLLRPEHLKLIQPNMPSP